jgi:sugar phosphate isomerase/epimerase
MPKPITDFSNLCIHTMTTKPWSLREAIDGFMAAGVPAITVWRQHIEPVGAEEAGRMLRDSGLTVVSLCRGGFFPAATEPDRQKALDDNRRAIDEAAAIGTDLVVLVCGAVPGMPLWQARTQIAEGIQEVLPHAEGAGVRLSIEALHPMYADSRSAVNTLGQANDMVESIANPNLGVTVDVYHLWWDPDLEKEIQRAGDKVFSFHICDWRTPTRDILNDRALMGDGCIDIRRIRGWVEGVGFSGWTEAEIFSDEHWATDQAEFVEKIKAAYLEHA